MVQIISIGQRGLAITFSKEDLRAIKDGRTLTGELVNSNGKTSVMFMRDRTFQDMQKKFSSKVNEAKARVVQGAEANEAASLGAQIADSDGAENPL